MTLRPPVTATTPARQSREFDDGWVGSEVGRVCLPDSNNDEKEKQP